MVKSMTAFARHSSDVSGYRLDVEAKTVNHRYLDIALRLPDSLRLFEQDIRERIREALSRGKVEMIIKLTPLLASQSLTLNEEALQYWQTKLSEADKNAELGQLNWSVLLRLPNVIEESMLTTDDLYQPIMQTLENVLQTLNHTRGKEGEAIAELIAQRLLEIEQWLKRLQEHLPSIELHLRQEMQKRLQEAQSEIDEARFEQEVLFWLNKMDVSEEIERLYFHIAAAREALAANEPKGRHLDFLMQEFNREANTLASKSRDTLLTEAAVAIKVLIEQMREQIQNVE